MLTVGVFLAGTASVNWSAATAASGDEPDASCLSTLPWSFCQVQALREDPAPVTGEVRSVDLFSAPTTESILDGNSVRAFARLPRGSTSLHALNVQLQV